MRKKIFWFVLFVLAIGLYIFLMDRRQNNIKSEICTNCTNDTIVNLRNGDLSLIFSNRYEKMTKEKMTMQVIRKGKVFEELNYTKKNANTQIELELEQYKLYTTDSLKITFSNSKFVYIHGFENEAEYAHGEHFVGCFLLYYKVDNQEGQIIRDGSRINIL
ncbi:hypothetical protein ABXT06_14155 [Flavobacterium sp. UW10123]|uniref:hypothetical protein n=1 Tax=Flavobacterium sp. UW10123 TaxID=3230800 RepID=UPI003395094E